MCLLVLISFYSCLFPQESINYVEWDWHLLTLVNVDNFNFVAYLQSSASKCMAFEINGNEHRTFPLSSQLRADGLSF